MVELQLAVVHPVNDGLVGAFGRGGDEDTLGATGQVNGGPVAVVEFSGAFEHHVHAVPVQLLRVVGRHDLDRTAAKVDGIARDLHGA